MRSAGLLAAALLLAAGCGRSGFPAYGGAGVDQTLPDATSPTDASTPTPDTGDVSVDPIDADPPDDRDVPPDTEIVAICGDGVVSGDEQCDDGELNSDTAPDACRSDCRLPRCGDGVLDSFEECDDGNTVDDDECSNACLSPAIPCTPCENSAECGRGVDHCVRLRDGAFCAIACADDDACPDGLRCDTVPNVGSGGGRVQQCIPDLEVCAGCFDRDGDGYGIGLDCLGFDCDDSNPNVNPGAEEICNDIDDDCDGLNDEGCPPDLIVDAETIELAGDFLFDRVEVLNGGRIRIPAPLDHASECSPDGPGCLKLRARIILIRADSGIDGSGAGTCTLGLGDPAGFGPGLVNVGPGGGAYGGAGGAGPELSGGRPYGTAAGDDIEMGSPGRGFRITARGFDGACDDLIGFDSQGGLGGGCVVLDAPDVDIAGFVRADGLPGEAARDGDRPGIVDGGAGGSGGGILVRGARVRLRSTATVEARGGRGGSGGTYTPFRGGDSCIGNGGGGGGGGRIKVFGGRTTNDGASISARGGLGATGPQNDATGGQTGSLELR